MLVEDMMSTDVVACKASVMLRHAVHLMLRERVGSVIVTDDGEPAGIVTETDILHAGYVTNGPFSDIPVRKVMSSPLVTISPSKTIRRAVEQMEEHGVKKLVVVEELEIVGILTASDISRHYSEIKSEIHKIEQPRKNRAAEDARFDLD